MLEKIREGSQGTIAKVVLGAVILSFALAGIGSYLGGPAETVAAVVNDQKISTQALESAVRNERQRIQRQLGENFERFANNPAFMQQVRSSALERLVVMALLDQAVVESGLVVGDEQVRAAIVANPNFQMDGQFSNDLYLRSIQSMGYSAAGFRELIRQDISRRQYLNSFTESEFVLQGEVEQLQQLLSQTRDIRYWQIDLEKLADKVIPTEQQVQAYFDSHPFSYQQPEMVAVEYVELQSANLAKDLSVSDEEVTAYYQDNADLFRSQEERRAAHILLTNDDAGREKAALIQQKLASGETFTDLVEAFSTDTFSAENGGDLDWFTRGVMGDAFDEAIFAMTQEGDVSELVESSFGLHLIKLTGIRAPEVKAFADVSSDIKSKLLEEKSLELYYQKQDQVTNLAFEIPDSLVDLAEETGLTVQTSVLFSRNKPPAAVASPKVQDAIFSDQVLRDGMNSDAIEVAEGHLMVVRLKEHQAARTKALDEVKPLVAQAVKFEQARVQAETLADSLLSTLNKGEQLIVDPNQPIQVMAEKDVTRNHATLDAAIREQAFAMAKPTEGSQYDKVNGSNFMAVIALDAVKQVEAEDADASLKQNMEQQAMERAYQELVNVLKAKAEILYPVAADDQG